MTDQPHIIILGAGPAGLGAASQLVRRTKFQVTVLDQNRWVGGNAASFNLHGIHLDYGSHRLHPSCDPKILEDIKNLIGDDLLDRPRHGRILLRKRWIRFPLEPLDLILRLPMDFSIGVGVDIIRRLFERTKRDCDLESFASVMEANLGRTICREFYFPFAQKIWGLNPELLSAVQARRRVANNSISKMLQKVFKSKPVNSSVAGKRFYYPRNGFGQISQAFYNDAHSHGVRFMLGSRVNLVEMQSDNRYKVNLVQNGSSQTLEADFVWSTIPITILAKILRPPAPDVLINASEQMDYRSMLLVYLVLKSSRFSEFDAHYFPERVIKITRLSEPKNYSGVDYPQDLTILCAELPCSPDDPEWQMDEKQLGDLVCNSLAAAGIPITNELINVHVKRLRYAYPIYTRGYEVFFDQLDEWIRRRPNLLSFGRQGLFAHDNTHHALFMAYSAVDCFEPNGNFNSQKWESYRQLFETHVVED